jgi:hypothetical protein
MFIVSPPLDTATGHPVTGHRESMSIARLRDGLRSKLDLSEPRRSRSRRQRRIASIRRETTLLMTGRASAGNKPDETRALHPAATTAGTMPPVNRAALKP